MDTRVKIIGNRYATDSQRIERFWSLTDRTSTSGCWLWTGYKYKSGYGRICFKMKRLLCSRFSWYLTYGEIPAGKLVCHTCDNRLCINPNHLFLGTHMDNHLDMVSKGRENFQKPRAYCKNGHFWTKEITYSYLKPSGKFGRQCKLCWKIKAKMKQSLVKWVPE